VQGLAELEPEGVGVPLGEPPVGDPDPPPPHAGRSTVIAASHARLAFAQGAHRQLSRTAEGWAAYGSTGRA
jgi:hypothetical protein